MKYGNKSLWKRIISSSFTLIILIVLLIILGKATWNITKKAQLSDLKLSRLENELNEINTRKDNLSNQIDYLSTKQGIEAELRSKFRAVKDGESVAVILLDDTKDSSSTIQSAAVFTSTTIQKTWWQKIFDLF